MIATSPPRPDPAPNTGNAPVRIVSYGQELAARDAHGHPIRGLRFDCLHRPTGPVVCRPHWRTAHHPRVVFPRQAMLNGVVYRIMTG